MATMQAAAVITAVDRASPVFQRVAAAAQAAANRYTSVAGRIDAATTAIRSSTMAMALPSAAAFAGLIQRTQDFERALVGVQIAGIADNLKEGVVDFERLRESAEQIKESAIRISKELATSPTGLLKAGEAAAKMGVAADKVSALIGLAGSVHLQDRNISPEKAAEFIGSMGKIYNLEGSADYEREVQRITNQWLAVANMTRTSASRLEEGLKLFVPLYASLGESFLNSAALVGTMTQAGLSDPEIGTALRSAGLRMLNPTHKGRDAMLVSGLWGEIQKRGLIDLTGSTAREAGLALNQLFPGQLKGKAAPAIRKILEEGERGKLWMDAEWQGRLWNAINVATGAKDAPTREANQEKMYTAILKGGGKIQMTEILILMKELQEQGKLTDAQLAVILEGKHVSRIKALFRLLEEFKKIKGVASGVVNEFVEAGNRLHLESSAGKWDAAIAAVDRALIRLRETRGIGALTESFETAAQWFADLPKGVQEFGGKALAASIGISALGLALNGVAKAGALVAASPVVRALLIGGGAAAVFAPELFRDYGDFGEEILFGPGAPIWTTLEKMKAAGTEVGAAFGELGATAGKVVSEVQSLLGLDPSGSLLHKGLNLINGSLDSLAEKARIARTEMIPAIKEGRPGDIPIGGLRVNQWGALFDAVFDALYGVGAGAAMRGQDPLPPLRLLKDIQQQRVDVHGQADVKVQNEVTIKIEGGNGQVVDQRGGTGIARVPLNTGKTMPDTGHSTGGSF